MLCPFCREKDTSVIDSRATEDGTAIRRRRLSSCCNQRFTTFERVQFRELTVIKKNGRKSQFDRDKLTRSINIALRKRPVDSETIDDVRRRRIVLLLVEIHLLQLEMVEIRLRMAEIVEFENEVPA